MEKQKRIPKRRFREFLEAGEWELSILGRLAVEVNRKAEAGSEAPVMMISSGEGFIEQKDRYSTDNAGSSLKNYTLIKQGELSYNHGYSKLRPFGSCFDLRVPEARIPFVYHTFELPKDDSRFYATYLNNGQFDNELKKRVSSTARMDGLLNISYADYMSLEICHPNIEEQTRIGDFCRRLDALISLHQQKLSKLKELKQAYLTEMFPAPGEKRPRRRFKGFSGDWEEYTLGQLCNEFHSGKFIPADKVYDRGRYPVYGGNGLRGYTDSFNHDGEYALIGRQGALCGNMNYSKGKAYFTEHAVAIKANDTADTSFLYYLCGLMDLGQYSGQSAQPGLAVSNIILVAALVPERNEQIAIGRFFQHFDELIFQQENKVAKFQSLKQAYLSELFV